MLPKHKRVRYITRHLADAFIQSDLQLIRLSGRRAPLERCGVKGLAQRPNSCAEHEEHAPLNTGTETDAQFGRVDLTV